MREWMLNAVAKRHKSIWRDAGHNDDAGLKKVSFRRQLKRIKTKLKNKSVALLVYY